MSVSVGVSGAGALFRDAHKMRGKVMVAQAGDRIMAINVKGMKHGERGMVRHIVDNRADTSWWGAWLWPEPPMKYPVLIVKSRDQWQNLSR